MSARIRVGLAATRGRSHREFEDALCVAGTVVACELPRPIWLDANVDQRPIVIAVIDGMGGHRGGARAASDAAVSLARQAGAWRSGRGALERDIEESMAAISMELDDSAQLDQRVRGMGATCVLVALDGDELVVANLGDARAWALRSSGHLCQLSIDHEVQGIPNAVSRCLGSGSTAVSPSILRLPVQGHRRLLLASDGLHREVDHQTILAALASPDPLTSLLAELEHAGDDVSLAYLDLDLDPLIPRGPVEPPIVPPAGHNRRSRPWMVKRRERKRNDDR